MRLAKVAAVLGVALFATAAATTAAHAQDFGNRWIDRMSRETQEEGDTLSKKPLTLAIRAGELVYFDDNIFLAETGEESDVVFVTFASLRLEYADTMFDAVLDVQANYNYYLDLDDASDDEQRLFGRIRYIGVRGRFELLQVLRRESDPTDVLFADRIERLLSQTTVRFDAQVSPTVLAGLYYHLQMLRFEDTPFDERDNNIHRGGASFGYRVDDTLFIVADAGAFTIRYLDPAAPANAKGTFLRAGVRGEPTETLSYFVLAGVSSAKSDDMPGGKQKRSTADIEANVRYQASPTVEIAGDYSRKLTFAGGASSFSTVDRLLATIAYQAMEQLKLAGRLQYDIVDSEDGGRRTFVSIGGTATYRLDPNISLDGGVTYRMGEFKNGVSVDFGNLIFHVGIIGEF